MIRVLKALSAAAMLAAIFLPLATCRGTRIGLENGSFDGIPSIVFLVWPAVFIAVEFFAPWPRFVRALVAAEPILILISAGAVYMATVFLALISIGAEVEIAAGLYLAESGLAGYFCASVIENVAAFRRRRAYAN